MLGLDDFIQRPLNMLTGLFGSVNERKIKAKQPMVARINGLEGEFEKKSETRTRHTSFRYASNPEKRIE